MSLFILSLSLYIPNAFGGLSFNIAAKGVILAFSPEHGYADWRNGEWRREFREGNGALEALLDNDKHDTHIFFSRIDFDPSCFNTISISDSPFRGSARLGMGFA